MSWRLIARAGLPDLLAEALTAARPGPLVLAGETGSGRTTALELAAQLVDERTDALIALRGARGHLATLRDHLPADLPVPRAGGLEAVTDALEKHADGRRPVVLLDDAHLADHATVQVLRALHVRTGGPLILTLATDAGQDPLDCLRYEPGFRRVDLPPLSGSEVVALVSAALDGPVDEATAEALRAATDGNPALLRRYLTAGALRAGVRPGDRGLVLAGAFRHGVELDQRGRARLRAAVAHAWRELALDPLDQLCRLALLAGEEEAVSLVWPQVLLLRGRAAEALRFLDDTGAEPVEARVLTRAFVLAFGPSGAFGTEQACALLDDTARANPTWANRLNAVRAWLLALAGDTAEARQVVDELAAGPDERVAVF
ncbi:AAA family ATPase, partial [Actinosynnema sp. NPDC023658]|uniref:AAA family ATPase n=1 Tax=Actinosynnema sp. NPDC023658 TaxID=3155465 RepID=UPI0033C1D1BC